MQMHPASLSFIVAPLSWWSNLDQQTRLFMTMPRSYFKAHVVLVFHINISLSHEFETTNCICLTIYLSLKNTMPQEGYIFTIP